MLSPKKYEKSPRSDVEYHLNNINNNTNNNNNLNNNFNNIKNNLNNNLNNNFNNNNTYENNKENEITASILLNRNKEDNLIQLDKLLSQNPFLANKIKGFFLLNYYQIIIIIIMWFYLHLL